MPGLLTSKERVEEVQGAQDFNRPHPTPWVRARVGMREGSRVEKG